MMKLRHWITVVALLALVVATVVGMVLTEGGQTVLPTRASKGASKQPAALVDQRPLQTARKLAALASTPEERDFANALQTTQSISPSPTPCARPPSIHRLQPRNNAT